MLKLADLIKAALNEVGCEELPSGCDDLSVDQSFIENNISNNEQPVSAFSFRKPITLITFKISVLGTHYGAENIVNFYFNNFLFISSLFAYFLHCHNKFKN